MQKTSRLDIRHLRYALTVADAGGFRAAADILNIAQPAISKAVKDTEIDMGFRIFDRSPTGLAITEAGRVFLEDARLAVAQFERTIRASRRNDQGARGHVIVGYSALATSRQISRGLDAFHAAKPDVQVEMHVMSTDTMLRNLKTGVIDVGFVLSHPSATDPDVAQRQAWTSPIGAVVPRDTGPMTLDDLRQAPFVMGLRENWRSWRALLDTACTGAGLEPNVVDEAWDVQVIMQRVAEGRGVTLYPMSAADSLPAALEIRQIDGLAAEMTIAMAWSTKIDTALLRDFRTHLVPPGKTG